MDASTQPTLEELETSWAPGVFGMKYLTGIRTTNLVLSVLPPADLAYNWLFVFLLWSITLLTLSRLVVRVEAMRDRVGTMTLYVDELELTVQNEECAQSAEGGSPPFITINTVTTTCII
ncbi:hypothetical protein SCP_0605890 [Sparassis crispa]|uniref:Uncharacterized protein n=1 Tax=Sparassis crispa TaxID=139825 RepID=A0A401GR28_9APHY|nr:hypothetical protein SCP_0605890 [Sparassis crispa]GBE84610.1 hypothetical protein SCP_0605890 [Sparassis crispa]